MTAERLLEAAQELSAAELDRVVEQLLHLRATRRAPSLSAEETRLLQQIQDAVPLEWRQRQKALHDAAKSAPWTEAQRQAFQEITCQIENAEAHRVELLAQLAALRGVSLPALMHQLGLRAA